MKRGGGLERRTPLKRTAFARGTKPLPRVSARKRARDRDLPAFRAAVLARDPWCRWPGCTRRSTHAHHVLPVGNGGSNDPANGAGLCAEHHDGVHHGAHGEPVEARRLGLLKSR